MGRFLCGFMFPTPSGKSQSITDKSNIKNMFSFIKLPNDPPQWSYHFAFPTPMNKSSCCSMFSPTFGVVHTIQMLNGHMWLVANGYCTGH